MPRGIAPPGSHRPVIRSIALVTLGIMLSASSPAGGHGLGDVFKRIRGSVVTIRVTERALGGDGPDAVTTVSTVGSGVLVSNDGQVITAAHVAHLADEIVVTFIDGSAVDARVVASEPDADVALLQLARMPEGAVRATLADSDAVEVGDQVFVVGAPYGLRQTLSVGHISARHEPGAVYGAMSRAEFFQTDAAINQGNSGGPMFSMHGEVVGIVSHLISKSGGSEGLGFVVTSNMARRLLLERRSVWSGLSGYLLSGELARALNLPQPTGLLVQRVAANSPAARIGLRPGALKAILPSDGTELTLGGDVILLVQGIPVGEAGAYERVQADLGRLHPGSQITITVLREGRLADLVTRLP
jgi:S1-C subfamily serine protease